MKYYLHEVNDVFAEVNSSEQGLTTAEAEKRLRKTEKTSWQRQRKTLSSKDFSIR